MTENDLQLVLWERLKFKRHDLVVPNAYLFHYRRNKWESDVLALTKHGYTHEFEIKVSASDFRQDFNKPKWEAMATPQYNGTGVGPNYIWMVCPSEILTPELRELLPPFCGLMVLQGGEIHTERQAVRLHSKKLPPKKRRALAKKLMYRVWRDKERYYD